MMKRKTMMAGLLVGAICWMGCGVDEEPMRPRGGAGMPARGGPDLAAMSPEERNAEVAKHDEAARQFVSWPDGKPGERDVMADIRTCREKLVVTDEYVRAHPLTRIVMSGKCMEELGWEFDPQGGQ